MESWRSLEAVAKAAQALRAPPDAAAADKKEEQDPAGLAALAAQVASAERAVLLALNFDVRLPGRGPVRWAHEVCRRGDGAAAEAEAEAEAGGLEAAASAILRDAGYTPAPLMAPPEALAKAALCLAASLAPAGGQGQQAAAPPPPPPAPRGPRLAAYSRVPQARAEALAAVLERTPAAVRMRAAAGGDGGDDGGQPRKKKAKRAGE
jgi:hypothetical protein